MEVTEEQLRELLAEAESTGKTNRAAAIREMLGEPPPPEPDTFGENVMDVAGEFASSFNRNLLGGLDYIGPGAVNAGARLSNEYLGTDFGQLPTLAGAHGQTPGAQGGFMEPGTGRNVVSGAGGAAAAIPAFAQVAGRNIASPAGAAMEFFGLGSAKPQSVVAPLMADTPATARIPQRTKTQQIGQLISEDPENVGRLGREIDPYTGRVVTNKAAKGSAKQGLKESLVSMIQGASGSTKQRLIEMLDITEAGRTNLRETINRPGDVIGKSLLDRFKVVKSANKQAGTMIDDAAKSLKGQSVDVSPAVNEFMGELDNMGVKFDPGTGTVSFRGSDIEKITGEETAFKNLLERMLNTDAPDAYDVHRLKRFIDNTVTYGKRVEGVSGNTERIMKRLRNGLDTILDQQFPNYAKANEQYAETIGALDDLQTLAGRKADLTGPNADKDIGILLRRILSNARSRVPIMDNIVEMDRVAKKYSSPGTDVGPYTGALGDAPPVGFDDDILTQALFADELERVFGTNATTSFMGDIGKAVQRGAVDTAVTGGNPWASATELVHSGLDRARGINEDEALKVFRELLEQQ
jgi:hypothetical protein